MRWSGVRSLVLGLVLACSVLAHARAADISVILDEARLIKMPDRVSTIVIGNPSIADAIVQASGWMVLTGKSQGTTNVVALDRSGAILMEKSVEVQGSRDLVVVYRGVERNSYSCTPNCDRRLTLGDSQPFFDATAGQITARNGLAAGAAQTR
jgi:hypothetical protein